MIESIISYRYSRSLTDKNRLIIVYGVV